MGVASELAVRFTADTSGLEAGGQKAEGLIGRMTSGLGKLGLAGLGVGVIKDAIGGVVGSFGELISAAEGADDAVARLNVVLGSDAADKLTKAAEANANALGLSKTAFLETAGAAANYLTNLGVGKDAAANMSAGLTELAPKLAAFANVPVEQAMNALQKGVGGATRGLKEMGIAISDEDIKAKALELGLQKVSTTHTVAAGAADKLKLAQEKLTATVAKYGEGSAKANLAHIAFAKAQEAAAGKTASVVAPLTEAAKAQALYALIQEQSAGANAAWADNQGDVANSMARVKAAMEDAKVAIGEKLLPVIAPLAQMFADALPGAIEKVTGALTPLLNGLGDVATILFGSFGPEMKAARDNLGPFATVLGDLRAVVLAIADAIQGDFSGAFDGLGEILPDIGVHFSGIYDLGTKVQGMFDAAGGYAGIFSSALAALTAALATAWANVQPLIDVVAAAGAKFVEFAGGPGHLMQTIIGTALVVAFLALAAAAASAAAGIIAALAPILIPIAAIVAAVVVLRKAWDTNFGGIREKTAAVVEWITTNVGPAITSMVETVKAVLGGMADWWHSNGDMIIGIVKGIWDTVAGLFQVAFATIKGLVSIFLNVIHGNFEGAGKALINMWGGVGAGLARAFKGLAVALLGTIATLTKNTVEAFVALGGMILTGLINGLKNAPGIFADFMAGMAKAAIAAFKKQFGISSPSKVMKGLGGDVIAGLVVGLTERASNVHDAIAAIASGLIDAARGALDSHSPSRAFADIGGDVVAGLDEGLAGMRDSAARLASDVSAGVGGAADAAITAAARFAEIGDISVTIDAQPLMQAVDGMKQAAGDLRQSLLDLQPVATDTGVDIGTLASGANIISMFEQLSDRGVALVPALASIGAMAVEAAGGSGLGALAAALTGPVALAIGGAIAVGVLLYKAWETNFGGIRDKVLEVTAIVQAKWTEVRAKLGAVFGEIWADLKPLRDRFAETWQSIQEKVAVVVSWIADNVKPLIESAFNGVMAALDGFITFWRANGDSIIAIVTGLWDTVTGIFSAAWAVLSGVVRAGIALLHGDFSGAGKILADTVRGWWAGVKQAFGGLAQAIGGVGAIIKTSIVDPMLNVGAQIVAGIQSGVMSAWNGMKTWLANKFADLPLIAKKVLGIASPSKEFAEIGENVVAGLELGLQGIKQIGDWIQKEMVGWVKDKDLENFGSIATLTKSLVDIFENTTKALKSLLSFDVSTSAAQISAQFKALVGTFQQALLEMKTLAQYAGSGAPKNKEVADAFLNFFDIQNIELVSKGFEATISLINGLLDIAAKLQTVKVPSASDIEALLEPMSKLGNVAARFIDKVGKPEGEDATAYFQNGANATAALASWAKSIADIVGIKFGTVAKDFEAQMTAAAAASVSAWNAVQDTALAWGKMLSTTREQLITGIQAYATAVGAAVSILKGAAELKIDVATIATAAMMAKAATAASDAVSAVAAAAKWWGNNAEDAAKVVAGVKAYGEAVGAAVGLLGAAASLDFSKAVMATKEQLKDAADVALNAYGELMRTIGHFVDMGAEARTALVQAVKDYAEAAGAAVGLLGGAAALDFTKAVAVTTAQLHDAADATLAALGELERVAAGFVTMGHEATGPLVQSIKDFAEGAGAAVDLLVKGAQGMNALGEIKRLSGIQPRLIRTILKQLRDVVDIVTDPKNAPKTPTEEQLAALKSLGDSSGVFDGIVKAAAGMNELGQVKRLSGVQPRLIRTVLSQLATVIGIVTDPKTALKPVTSEQAAAIKAIGDSSGVLSSLSSVADGFAKMSGKLSIPSDLSERVTTLIDAMRTVVNGIAGAMTGDNAINLKDALAGADIAEAVGRIGDAFGPIFDAINAAIESPFGRIKATGQRGDTFRQNIANRIKASLVAAVTALSEALGSMPTITIPDGLAEQIDKLAGIYDRILDVIGKLDGVKIDTRAVAQLAAALGVLAGGVGGVGGNISVTGGGSNLSITSGPGGGIVINNEFNPTLTPLPITINTTNNITVGGKVVDAIATEVQRLEELKLRQGGTP